MRKTFMVVILILGLTALCFAQEVVKLEEITVTAQRRATDIKHISDTISIITRDQLKLKAQTDLFSVLRDIPGVSFKRCGGPGQWTWVTMRDTEDMERIEGVRLSYEIK